MRPFLLILFTCLFAMMSAAENAGAPDEAEVKARTVAISKSLRCVVCQSESIHDSNAPLAADMRALVERRVRAGDSDAQVRDYFQVRYGDYVLMRPPLKASTILLWLGPLALVVLGAGWFFIRMRTKPTAGSPGLERMSDADTARVQAALSGTNGDEDQL